MELAAVITSKPRSSRDKTQDADPGWLPFCTDLSFSSLWLLITREKKPIPEEVKIDRSKEGGYKPGKRKFLKIE